MFYIIAYCLLAPVLYNLYVGFYMGMWALLVFQHIMGVIMNSTIKIQFYKRVLER